MPEILTSQSSFQNLLEQRAVIDEDFHPYDNLLSNQIRNMLERLLAIDLCKLHDLHYWKPFQ
jgi:hypothetical protein